MAKTFEELHREALQVQDACNLSGVVHSFSRAMTDLWEINRTEGKGGTDWVNSNAVPRLYADKIKSLAGECVMEDFEIYNKGWLEKEANK